MYSYFGVCGCLLAPAVGEGAPSPLFVFLLHRDLRFDGLPVHFDFAGVLQELGVRFLLAEPLEIPVSKGTHVEKSTNQ
jgi:hypothetical protein